MTLLLDIARCAIMKQQLEPMADASHPCHGIVRSQSINGIERHQLPEPWNGDIEKAPLLFISSNPAISHVERYPTFGWSDAEVAAFFEQRFGSDPDSPIVGGTRVLKVDGTRGRANPYLAAIKARAAELGCPEPGSGYAVTEVVHCKSSNEKQGDVRGAMPTCVTRYGSAVLQRSAARAFVFVGRIAAEGAKRILGLECSPCLQGPALFAGRQRMVAFLPHPAGRESKKTFGGRLTDEELRRLRKFLSQYE